MVDSLVRSAVDSLLQCTEKDLHGAAGYLPPFMFTNTKNGGYLPLPRFTSSSKYSAKIFQLPKPTLKRSGNQIVLYVCGIM